MNRRTHAWIAVRAIALLEDEGKSKKLVELLKPHAPEASIGAWIPDLADAKRGGSKTENHILKMEPFDQERFVVDKQTTMDQLGPERHAYAFLRDDTTLADSWWAKGYKGDVKKPGQHLANRAMSLAITIEDLLLLGKALGPKPAKFASELAPEANTTADQAGVYFFMLSHFAADACQPCHGDARDLADYSNGLHKELEAHWSKLVGKSFEDAIMEHSATADELLTKARAIDDKFGIEFEAKVPPLSAKDSWQETINIIRGSFAIASIIAPPGTYPYKSTKKAPFETVLPSGSAELKKIDEVVLHDAVLNVAMLWKNAWDKVA